MAVISKRNDDTQKSAESRNSRIKDITERRSRQFYGQRARNSEKRPDLKKNSSNEMIQFHGKFFVSYIFLLLKIFLKFLWNCFLRFDFTSFFAELFQIFWPTVSIGQENSNNNIKEPLMSRSSRESSLSRESARIGPSTSTRNSDLYGSRPRSGKSFEILYIDWNL